MQVSFINLPPIIHKLYSFRRYLKPTKFEMLYQSYKFSEVHFTCFNYTKYLNYFQMEPGFFVNLIC